jgi:hypothetical protein
MFICKKYCRHTNPVLVIPYLHYLLWAEIPRFMGNSLKVMFFWSQLTTANEDTLYYKYVFELNTKIFVM